MKGSINEDINYIKYLMGYQKGRVISEQKKIISEQKRADYDKIISDLLSTYKPVLNKYGFDNLYFIGKDLTDPSKLSTNFGDNKPTKLVFVPTATALATAKTLASDNSQKLGTDVVNFSLTYGTFGDDDTNSTRQFLQRTYAKSLNLPDEKSNANARTSLLTDMSTIGTTISGLVDKVSSQQDISANIKTIKSDIEKATGVSSTTTGDAKTTTTAGTTTAGTTTGSVSTSVSTSDKFDKPIVTASYDSKKKVFAVEAFAVFGRGITETEEVYAMIVNKIKEDIFTYPEIVENKDYLTLSFADIRGGASNRFYNSEKKKDVEVFADVGFAGDDYKTPKADLAINFVNGKDNTEGSISNGPLSASNRKFAVGRATNFLKSLKSVLPNEYEVNGEKVVVKISPVVKEKIEGYNVETGGKYDYERSEKYPIPGQHVYAKLEITFSSVPSPLDSKKCLVNSRLKISYKASKANHNCDTATFDVFLNNILIGTVDLGNGPQLSSKYGLTYSNVKNVNLATIQAACRKNYTDATILSKCLASIGKKKNLSNTTSDGKYGGDRSAQFTIDNALIDKIIPKDHQGELTVTIKGKQSSYYSTVLDKYSTSLVFQTHAEVPLIQYYPSNKDGVQQTTPTVDEESLASMQKCGGDGGSPDCTKVDLFTINPCELNKQYAILYRGS